MLKNIHPLLFPDLLHALASMGHGDEIAIVDANFPATSVAAHTILGHPLQIGTDVIAAVEAVLTVLPVDTFDPDQAPVRGMQVVDAADAIPDVVAQAAPYFAGAGAEIVLIERFAFYEAAMDAYAILQTTETRHYGNFIIRKGVV